MVKRIFNYISREINGLHQAAYLIAVFTFTAQIIAFLRDRLFASTFGAGEVLDLYYASFRIPDLLFVTISSLVSVSVLVPLIVKYRQEGPEAVQNFLNSIFTFFIISMIIVSAILFFFIPDLLKFFFGEIYAGQYGQEFVAITRILLLSPFFLGISSLYGSIVQSYRKFFVYALSPVLYNLGIIVGVIYLYPLIGLKGLVLGVVLGSVLHWLILVPSVSKEEIIPKISKKLDLGTITSVATMSFPRTITLASGQLSLLILITLAGLMAVGSISVFTLAYNLQSVPLALIGASYSMAAFPTLAGLYTNGHMDEFADQFIKAARHIIFWSIPFIIWFIVFRAHIVRLLFGAGEFTWEDTRLTAAILAVFAISIVANSLILLFVRGYYAIGETKKPLIYSVISTLITVVAAFSFIALWQAYPGFASYFETLLKVEGLEGTLVLMLPLAYSIGMICNVILLWSSFEKKFEHFSNELWRTLFHIGSASIIMGYVSWVGLQVFDNFYDIKTVSGLLQQAIYSGLIGLAAGIFILVLMGNREIKTVWRTLHTKIWKSKPMLPEPEEL